MLLTVPEPLSWLRIICGIWFIPHILGKIQNFELAAGSTFAKAGLRPPKLFAALTILLEILAAAGLVLGIWPRLAAVCAALVLGGASYAVLRINGFNWRWQRQGPEYMIFWALTCILSAWSVR